jgi:hypothetical protein
MQGEWKPFLVVCLIVLCVGGGFGAITPKSGLAQEITAAHENAGNGSKDLERWALSDKIALGATIAAIAQFVALIVTIGVMISSSHRQLRAYIHIEGTWAKPHGPKWSIGYKLKNAGQTPATSVTLAQIVEVVPWPMVTLPKPVDETYFGPMSPLGDAIDCGTEDEIIVAPEDLLSETRAIVLVGRVTYRDAFRRTQTTDFCFYVTGGDYPPEGAKMFIYEQGDEST